MNENASRYYDSENKLSDVIQIHDNEEVTFDFIREKDPSFPRSWYELSRLVVADRLEFIRGFWVYNLPYFPHVHEALDNFFSRLDDIGIYLIQGEAKAAYRAEMAYSLTDNSSFFCGGYPIVPSSLDSFKHGIHEHLFPEDYLAFLQIHDGFRKHTDTGVFSSGQFFPFYTQFQQGFEKGNKTILLDGEPINPHLLYPFYQSFDLEAYQCFYGDWYPDQEMGNVYYSEAESSISLSSRGSEDNLSFPNFLSWLAFYLEGIV